MVTIEVALISSWFLISGFVRVKVSMSCVKFPVRITGVLDEQLLPNKSTNDFLPVAISKCY